jgi:uncharacterized protein YaaN involved in tellurite resistance
MEEWKEMQAEAPTLTFTPFAEEEQTPAAVIAQEAKPVEQPVFDESNLSAEERKMVEDFASQIELSNSNLILQYGAGAQKKMSDFSETTLSHVKTRDLGEIGDALSRVVSELRSFDEEEEKGIFGIFKKGSNKIEAMKAKYAKAETNVTQIVHVLEDHQVTLLKDVAMLDKLYELNKTYFKELSMYILAGKKRLRKAQEEELPALQQKAAQSGLPEDAQAVNDMLSLVNRFEKKVHDLELTRMISIQMAPQIRLVQNNDTMISEKIQSTLVNTIPLWKSQMVLALGVSHSAEAAKAQREVTNLTNELLKKNADILKTATIETARESERGVVDLETLQHTNQSLIATLDEVMKIQDEGKEKRMAAEAELGRIEGELRDKLRQVSTVGARRQK